MNALVICYLAALVLWPLVRLALRADDRRLSRRHADTARWLYGPGLHCRRAAGDDA